MKRNNNKKLMLLALLLLAIGFATVTTTLMINGKINLMPDEEGFKEGVLFTEYSFPNADDGTIIEADTTGKTITFTTKDLKNVGDKAILEYKIKNESYYDAKVTGITCYFTSSNTKDTKSEMTSKTNEYIQIKPATGFFPVTIEKETGKTEATTLTVELVKSYIGDEDMDLVYQCVLDATTDLEAAPTGDVESAPTIACNSDYKYPCTDHDEDGVLSIGDEIAIGEEHFYVISNEGGKLAALAKYNLNAGGEYNDSWTAYTTTTGIQDSTMIGWTSAGIPYKGTMKFSDSASPTWTAGEDGIEAKATGTLHDALANYKSTLPAGTEVRLITKSEIEALVNDGAILSSGPIKAKADAKGYQWLYSSSYWSGSALADNASSVWSVISNGLFNNHNFGNDNNCGVRPVIEIEA